MFCFVLFKLVPPPEEDAEEEKYRRERQERSIKWTNFTLKMLGISFIGLSGYTIYLWGEPEIGADGQPLEDEFSVHPLPLQYLYRTWPKVVDYIKSYEKPTSEKLLPDPVQPPYIQPKYTLVFEPNGILLHPEWTYKHGWRFKKRPFVDQFLQQCGPPLFETVSFTSDSIHDGVFVVNNLDTKGSIMFRLFRDSTRYVNGKRIKDLNCLNRDLSKVILVDWDKEACSLNPHNCIILDKWLGEGGDSTLIDLAIFLRTLAARDIDDVREIIAYYSQFDNPLEVFKENQRKAAEETEKLKSKNKNLLVSSALRKIH